MITIIYQETGKRRRLTVTGHAGAAKKGEDIFCAAASTLILTLQSALQREGIRYDERVESGLADIICERPGCKQIFYTCMCGFMGLATMYPEYYEVRTE